MIKQKRKRKQGYQVLRKGIKGKLIEKHTVQIVLLNQYAIRLIIEVKRKIKDLNPIQRGSEGRF